MYSATLTTTNHAFRKGDYATQIWEQPTRIIHCMDTSKHAREASFISGKIQALGEKDGYLVALFFHYVCGRRFTTQ